ncbi:hypothetical protein ACFV1U_34695 [Streptomyces microflavus]|uniref:hypothetical protein n=1 Tax=Streptomyces microflavus TaxID=1919 RepID=UPI00369E655D
MTLLVVGGSGFLGTELIKQAGSAGRHTVATYASRPGVGSSATWKQLDRPP